MDRTSLGTEAAINIPILIHPSNMPNQTYTIHPVANLFPDMSEQEFAELKTSIGKHGQFQPIVVHGDLLLDGRHRLKACDELGIDPKVMQFTELGHKTHPATWVLTTNARRRNLTPDQKLAVLSAYDTWRKTMVKQSTPPTQAQPVGDPDDSAQTDKDGSPPAASDASEFPGRNHPEKSPTKRPRGRPTGSGSGRQREHLAKAADQSQYRARQMLRLREHLPALAIEVEEGRVTLKEATRQLKAHQKGQSPSCSPSQAKPRPETAWRRLYKALEKVRAAWLTDQQADLHQRICDYLKTTWPLEPAAH